MTLRVAFIGAGRMASHHVRVVKRLTSVDAQVVGVYDRATDRAEEFAALAGAPAFPSMEALLAEAHPDVVHVCTPPGSHFEGAYAALDAGAHVYVEKPFVLTASDARTLLDLAAARGRLVCAGHQLLFDRAFVNLLANSARVGTAVQIDSHFAFQPPGGSIARRGAMALAPQLIDILPHPFYILVAALEHFAPGVDITLASAHAGPADLHATLSAGDLTGRLSVSLRARPVASSLNIMGTGGSLTCDFVRSIVIGACNAGTEALEKIANPLIEASQLVSRTARSLARRAGSGGSYPGLAELIDAFYSSIAAGGSSPTAPGHLLRVTELFAALVARIEAAAHRVHRLRPSAPTPSSGRSRLVAVTGARGFLGTEIARNLTRVRGIGRGGWPNDAHVQWVVADLSHGVPTAAVTGADVVVHAAAETSGGYSAHQHNTLDATRHLMRAMHAAGVSRLVLVSSLSVLRPPRTTTERQDERTPRPNDPRPFGPYTYGKCLQEELVEREAAELGIATRIIRPGALIDWSEPALPGLMGRRLFGRWHLGLGRPHLPIAVCDVERCAEVIAWCATHFEEAPPVVNLLDPSIGTRGQLVERFRESGWSGRIVWVPIAIVALGLAAARRMLSLVHGRSPDRLDAWSILRPRRYDARAAERLFETVHQGAGDGQEADVAVNA